MHHANVIIPQAENNTCNTVRLRAPVDTDLSGKNWLDAFIFPVLLLLFCLGK